ncbi:hypothetical protein AAL_02491 [Moelleriella libera RCEF 2490]|uniref:Nuclear distribution protein n=1 Tax=Moelleriella libera RCEF 2490 TaxID=1081109 RepID=A0A166PTI8_9HYPO|nr:hypothetical protein AAL_02491 [Moelleriella libera RCEF 2490]
MPNAPRSQFDNPLDQTTLATISLLESRILRIEHLLYGRPSTHPPVQQDSAARRLKDLERKFSLMISNFRVYDELLKTYRSNPDLFHAPGTSVPPSQLSSDAIQAIVLASASTFSSTLSSLTAVKDCSIPDSSDSAQLINLTERMKAIETTQIAQMAEISELRQRSEAVMLSWYESGVLANSQSLANVESRVQGVEREIRRSEVAGELEKQI